MWLDNCKLHLNLSCVRKPCPDFEHVLDKRGSLQCYEERSLYRKCLLPAGPSSDFRIHEGGLFTSLAGEQGFAGAGKGAKEELGIWKIDFLLLLTICRKWSRYLPLV